MREKNKTRDKKNRKTIKDKYEKKKKTTAKKQKSEQS